MSTGDDRALTQVLQRVALEATPARLPADLWSRGRRRHRRRTAAAVAVTAALVSVMALPVVLASSWQERSPRMTSPRYRRGFVGRCHSRAPCRRLRRGQLR